MRRPFAVFLSFSSVPCVAFSSELPALPGEAQYQQAANLLKKSDAEYADLMRSLLAKKTPTDMEEKKANLALVQQRLSESAQAGHPVAEYRLMLLYQVYLVPGKEQEMCQLAVSSLEHGFAPAALYVDNTCLDYVVGPKYIPALQNALGKIDDFARYYPQPAVWLTCGARPTGVELQSGSQNDYRAELYKVLASQTNRRTARPLRIEYLEKALATNGCPYAHKRLEIERNAQ
ncbi:hypothetical protein BLL37_23840 [Pseudomonas azotoformans]|uniref:Sel1 repeat family protein n=2 Tax=Pseudomonas TaxID=286 RepID=A0A1V2JAC1_PSEAZ|nr:MULTISPECIES: hypothetical protein [Pseudomonas]KTB66818.1 hypothetical protein AO066_06565 [Pseudomonas fluorescens]MDR9878414.1 hypothetical protein [Pseudomonas allii]OIN50629.1 hypothetical protein BFL39_06410 [Pseudomonas azotoformans]ONH42205.1 hypothetical protein BLL37_23840 [Pseudomonas azotoformans]SDN36129.1 hypothetical protein SAMN04489799_1766 [Pseudomonas azotoformans]